MNKFKKLLKKITISVVIFSLTLWSLGIDIFPFKTETKIAKAAGVINVEYMDDGGPTPETFLDTLGKPEGILEISMFDAAGGTLNSVAVCIDETPMPGNNFNAVDDLESLSIWKDTNGDKMFGTSTDTMLASSSSWVSTSHVYMNGGSCWKITFSSLAQVIPTDTASKLVLFVVATAKANLDADPLHQFFSAVLEGGIDITSAGTITDTPQNTPMTFQSVMLGQEEGMMGAPLLISEIQTSGTGTTDEFIEIYNRDMMEMPTAPSGPWMIGYAPGNTASDLNATSSWLLEPLNPGGSIPGNGFYLVSHTGYDGGINNINSASTTYSSFDMSETGGYVGLFDPMGGLVDLVGYGTLTDPTKAEGENPASAPSANGSIERKAYQDSDYFMMTAGVDQTSGNSEDSNNNLHDFIVRPVSDPQNSNAPIEQSEAGFIQGSGGTQVLINEVMYNTGAGQGWIELYNRDNMSPADVSGWKIKTRGQIYIFPGSVNIDPLTHLVVYWNKIGTDNPNEKYTSNSNGTTVNMNMGTFGGDVLLTDSGDVIKDYVQYGGPGWNNEALATSTSQWMEGNYVPNCLYGQSIGRQSTSGEDYNNSGDWQMFTQVTPGYENAGGDSTAPTAVTNVVLTDTDNVPNSGLNGNDIRISWTPATLPDPGFERYEIFLLPAGTSINFNTHKPIDFMSGGQYIMIDGVASTTYIYYGAPFITEDSTKVPLSSGTSYVAYVLVFDRAGNKSTTAQSAPAILTAEAYDVGSDNNPPFIMHMGAWHAPAGIDLNLYARFKDDRAMHGATPARIVWKAGSDSAYPDLSSGATTDTCTLLGSDFYNCTISWNGGWSSTTVIGYYLKALDENSNEAFMSASPGADMSGDEVQVQASPFFINIDTAASDAGTDADLSGFTYKSDGAPLSGVVLVLEGTTLPATTSDANGYFAFADDIMDYGSYNLMAFKDNYMDNFMNVFKDNNVSMYLNEGNMNMMSGGDMPRVTWTAPGPEMWGAPTDIYCTSDCATIGAGEMPIVIGFNRPMSPSTINDQDASNAGSNIYLTTNGQDRVSGKVYYDENMNEARFYATSHSSLNPNTYYTIVVSQSVTDKDGVPIEGGMTADGSFTSGFTTMMDNSSMNWNDFGTKGNMMPPFVKGTTPFGGEFKVNKARSIVVEFSEPMNSASINTNTIKLYPVTNPANWTLGTAVPATVTLDQATQRIATLDPTDNLNISYDWYVIRVMGQVKNTMGIYMSPPDSCADINVCSELQGVTAFESSFQIDTAAAADSSGPTVKGSFPQTNSTGVNVGLQGIEVGFSEPIAQTTINTSNITLKTGSKAVTGTVKYDTMSNMAKFMPNSALSANTQYILTLGAGITDLAGFPLATSTVAFTTGSADTQAPEVIFANGDDFSVAISYSEPMNAAKQTDTTNWSYSVLNPANYRINGFTYNVNGCFGWGCAVTLKDYTAATGTLLSEISGLTFSYDGPSMTVLIEGFDFALATDFQIFVDNVRDKSNNIISDSGNISSDNSHLNASRGPVMDSTETYGMLGPGGGGMSNMGGTGANAMDMGKLGMMKAGAFPMNMMAGQSSIYFVDIPITKSIPIGGKIKLTFPTGFDVSSAAKDPFSPVNNDINEWNSGVVTIGSVTGNQTSRTVTIVATTSATQASDYLHMDIKGIVNSSIPREFGTDGYTVDIKTFTSDGALLESINTMPFFIKEGGNLAISGQINGVGGGDSGTMTVFLGSPMTGPMEKEVTITAGSGSYSFTGLSSGEYQIFTDPFITIGSTNYMGSPMPEPIWLSGASTTKNITLSQESAGGAAVTVSLTGDFSTGGVADDVDVFAGSPNGFRVKTLTGLGDVSGATTTIYLPAGDWMVGVGPAMPKGPMSGPPPMPDWMSPMPTRYVSDGVTPGTKTISIAGQASYTVSGSVVDDSNNGIANAEVFAYQPMGGFGGANTKSAADGSFVLKIPVLGTYKIGAMKPGLPAAKEKVLDITGNASGLTFKINKPAYTISGKVLNASSQAIAYAPVWANDQNGWAHADTMTDATGNYILYVSNGSWKVETDAPGVGWMQYDAGRAISINGSSASNINLSPINGTNYYTISGIVGIDTNGTYSNVETPFTNMPIRAVQYNANGVYQGREFNGMTDSSGNYTISVPEGIYRVDIWTPEYGEIGVNNQNSNNTLNEVGVDDDYANNPANINASGGNVVNADIIIVNSGLNTITLNIENVRSGQTGFLDVEGVDFAGNDPKPNGFHLSRRIDDLTASNTVKLADGDYLFFLNVPGLGEFSPSTGTDPIKGDIVVSGDRDVDFTLIDIDDENAVVTISGTVTNSVASPIEDAWVWVGNPTNGYHQGTQTASNGTYSLKIPVGSGYKMGADKPGYMSGEPSDLNATVAATKNFILTANSVTISGYLKDNSSNNIPNGMVRIESSDGKKQYAPADGNGYYSVGAANGTWTIYGMADGFNETSSSVTVSGNTSKNLTLTSNNNWQNKSKKKQITPASGGTIDDTTASGTGMKLVIPPNALGSSNSAGNINTKTTSAVTETNSSVPVGGEGISVTATDNSGQPITNLNDYVDMEKVLYKADVDAGLADESLTYDKLKNTNLSYWDDTLNDWSTLSTNRKAYYASGTEWVLYANVNATSSFEAFIDTIASAGYTDYKLVYTSKTNHFTIFAIIMPFVIASTPDPDPDPTPDPTPTPSGGGGGSVSWCTSVTYTDWDSVCVNGYNTREVDTKSPSTCTLTSAQQAELRKTCSIETEEVEEVEVLEIDAVPMLISISVDELYLEQGSFITRADVNEIMKALGVGERNHEGEVAARGIIRHKLGIGLEKLELRMQYALTNFITYGSPDTYKLGSGERAGVINSFRSAFGKIPETDADWQDVVKIANGRWPGIRNKQAETKAADQFRKIYLRNPDYSNPHDDAAVVVMAYGLRPANRNTNSEAAGVKIFRGIYKYSPSSAVDWDIVRAISYSGATR